MPVASLHPMDAAAPARRPRLGFAGLGWIGAQRMQAASASGLAEISAVCEPDPGRLETACAPLPARPEVCDSFLALLEQPLDGVVIATPNRLHEPQAAAALARNIPVFSQKPLALSAAGASRLLQLARSAGVPLGVDWSYRWLSGMQELKRQIAAGALGDITAVELCFHNAWGPDAAWYYDPALSGGGCLLDLGCHLLDLCHWLVGANGPLEVHARCFREGRKLPPPVTEIEDYVAADIDYESGQHVQLSCSWRASAGCGAVIGCRIFGTRGGAAMRNLNGSFYDFEITLHRGAESLPLGSPPDDWGGRALVDWAARLNGPADEANYRHLQTTAGVIDRIYGRKESNGKKS